MKFINVLIFFNDHHKSRKWLANSDLIIIIVIVIIIILNHAWKCTQKNCCIKMHWESF